MEHSVGVDVDADVRAEIGRLPADRRQPGLDAATGSPRADIDVAEITDLLRERLTRTKRPRTMRVIVHRTRLAPGEQPTLFQMDGYKYSCFVTNTGPGLSIRLLDARHRAHVRVEDGVRTGKDTGLGHLPSKSWTVNLAWCHAVTIAVDLLEWLKLLGCPDIAILNRAEPATLRYRLLHVPARLVRRARIRWLRIPRTRPWATALTQAFDRIRALPSGTTRLTRTNLQHAAQADIRPQQPRIREIAVYPDRVGTFQCGVVDFRYVFHEQPVARLE